MPKTYNDIYFSVRNKLRESGVEAFSLEARILLAAAAGKTTEQLMRDMYLYTSPEIEERAHSMIERRLQGEPLAYISGSWEFYGLPMTVTPDVLIPRMDTEILVDAAIDAIKGFGMKGRVLDLCCGSGCIACAIAHELPAARVVAADISPSALEVCRKNIKDNKLTSRIIPMNADATTWPPMSIGSFDVIVSNPPYIPSFELIELDCSVRDYEPMTALDGGEDGLDFYRAIIKYWTITMRPNGLMMFEVGEGQADEVKMMLLKAGFVSVEGRNDTLGFERVVIGKWKNEF
ncbi:MAG TPA: peptide chain release factor N(5)-glutamine methyltransferase [Clostridiales bacterium]|nr:peptide chain release factor N(5)-glutamine methyltransferase [Clostridiales bacterium]